MSSNELDSAMESTNLHENSYSPSPHGISANTPSSVAEPVLASMTSTSTPANLVSYNTEQHHPTRASVTATGLVEPSPLASEPPAVPDSVVPGDSPASSPPVISLGTLLYLPVTLWSATLAFTVFGIIWGAA
ncbi:hypothetical protein ED733_000258 [Metarhizium rileyi]|uniref:Uncharacterized protein n=1 Tax=Metarhizium rileyi (strain RCEF 4871) TaxID=1649241 RepID=A0A5C6G623_METRR|nr:hypothetical protein ED733_000258 [Metarhizium rileyi]